MAWRDKLREASFREAPFLWDDADGEFGRRFAAHEYPGRDAGWHEDLGRKSRALSIRAYVLGEDYMAARDLLVAAIETPGAGTLVHPYLGAIRVACVSARLRESTREGGMARFDLQFAEQGDNRFPRASEDSAAAVDGNASAASTAVQSTFNTAFSTAGAPSWVADQAKSLSGDGLSSIEAASGRSTGDEDKSADFARRLAKARADLASLVASPGDLGVTLIGLVADAAGLSGGRAALGLLGELDGFGADLPTEPNTTAARKAAGRNQDAITRIVRRGAAIEAARAASTIAFASHDEATGLRDVLAARLDVLALEAADAGEDDAWAALVRLRAAVVRDLNSRGARLPRLVVVTPATTRPALVLAQNLYGDDPDRLLDREAEIIALNDIAHPLFVAGGEPIQVLTGEGRQEAGTAAGRTGSFINA